LTEKEYDIVSIRGNLSQEEFADQIGISRELVSKMENGKMKISKATKVLLEKYVSEKNTNNVNLFDGKTHELGYVEKKVDLSKLVSDMYQKQMALESRMDVLQETIVNVLHSSTGKQAALISAELQQAADMVLKQRLSLLKG